MRVHERHRCCASCWLADTATGVELARSEPKRCFNRKHGGCVFVFDGSLMPFQDTVAVVSFHEPTLHVGSGALSPGEKASEVAYEYSRMK